VLDSDSGKPINDAGDRAGNDGVIYDGATRKIYTSNGVDANLVHLRPVTPDTYKLAEATTTRPYARTMALDPKTKKLYLVTARARLIRRRRSTGGRTVLSEPLLPGHLHRPHVLAQITRVGVGMPVAQHPSTDPYVRSYRITALASGRDDQTLVRVRVADVRDGKPMGDQAKHATPAQMMALAAAALGCGATADTTWKRNMTQARAVARHAEVAAMTGHHGPQELALLGNGAVHAPSEFPALTACSVARRRLALVSRRTMNLPFRVCPQQCVKPRKSKVCGLACPRRRRLSRAKRPNSISRVLSGCAPARRSAASRPPPVGSARRRRETGIPRPNRRHKRTAIHVAARMALPPTV